MSSNPLITNNDVGVVQSDGARFKDELLTFAGAATVLEGTILARKTTTGALIPFVKGGSTDGDGIPVAVINYAVTATGAGDIPIRALETGTVRAGRLIIDADGDASNIDAAVLDQLRDFSIFSVDVSELNIQDNQ